MGKLRYSIPGVNEEIDACREMAYDAIVTAIFGRQPSAHFEIADHRLRTLVERARAQA